MNIAKGQRCAHVPTPSLSNTAPFYEYLKVLKATGKGKKSKEGLEVTRENQPKDLSHRKAAHYSFLLIKGLANEHTLFGSMPKGTYIGEIRYLK